MAIFAKEYKIIPTGGDRVTFHIFIEDNSGNKTILPVFCSNTLKAVWGINNNANLFDNLYPLVRNIIRDDFSSGKIRSIQELSPLAFTTYDAPEIPPQPKYSLPDTINIQQKQISCANLPCKIRVKHPSKKMSFIGKDIAKKRDHINSLFKLKYKFKLFEIQEERAIVEMYMPCDIESEYVNRLLALRNLISWVNKKGLSKVLDNQIKTEEGTIYHLDKFLDKEYPSYGKKKLIGRLRSINRILSGYPIHKDSEKMQEGYKELGILWPISDFRFAWEKILSIYSDTLEELLKVISKR